MAEKKSTAKKSSSKKDANAKVSNNKKSQAKKASSTATTKKVSNANAQHEKSNKKNVEKSSKPTHVSKKTSEDNSSSWMIAAVVLAIFVIVLVGIVGFFFLNNGDDVLPPTGNNDTNDGQTGGDSALSVLVIEDPSCTYCEVDFFIEQLKTGVFPNLEVEKISFDSERGEAILEAQGLDMVPVYFFSGNIDQRDDWETDLSGAFAQVSVEGESMYLLNPQISPIKVSSKAVVETESAIVIGDENAPVTVFEFSDFECPFCAIAEGNEELLAQFKSSDQRNANYQPPIPAMMEEYVESGQVKIVFYNFPIASLHPQARIVHNAALCANEQDMAKDYMNMLWDDREEWISASDRSEVLKQFSADLGLDETEFNECLDNEEYDAQIDAEIALAQSYGVTGTPAFFIERAFLNGAQDYSVFKSIIEAELAKE